MNGPKRLADWRGPRGGSTMADAEPERATKSLGESHSH